MSGNLQGPLGNLHYKSIQVKTFEDFCRKVAK